MKKQWQLLTANANDVQRLSRQLGCPPLIARLLAIRGIQSATLAHAFLNPSLGDLRRPTALVDMDTAVRRIQRALHADEGILVFGDYDADGITATALLTLFLRSCGARVSYHIPHRMTDGYGMGVEFIEQLPPSTEVGLIITADCGTGSGSAITRAKHAGIDTIVTDHHPAHQIPADAVAVINPTRPDCRAGLAHLAGVGVAFYLTIALRAHLRSENFWKRRQEPNLKQLCDLVAIGTIADMAPLTGENRTLAATGIQAINADPRPGVAALLRVSNIAKGAVDAESIAFRLAPRINAAGRLAHARMACQLLLTPNRQRAGRLAAALDRLNSRRQSLENQLLGSILERLPPDRPPVARPVLVVAGKRWHEGILGIVAARLMRRFERPAVVISVRDGKATGSGRSIDGIDLSSALSRCSDLLDRFGGHPLAAGLTLPASHITAFRHCLEAVVGRMIDEGVKRPALNIDAEIPLDAITPSVMADIDRLGPFGQGNPHPLFMDKGVRVHASQIVGARHRRMTLARESGDGRKFAAIQFNVADHRVQSDRFAKIAYRPQWNHWNGKKSLQLMVVSTLPE